VFVICQYTIYYATTTITQYLVVNATHLIDWRYEIPRSPKISSSPLELHAGQWWLVAVVVLYEHGKYVRKVWEGRNPGDVATCIVFERTRAYTD